MDVHEPEMLAPNCAPGKYDTTKQGYQIIADSVLSARTVRPGGKAGQQGQATDALRRAHEQQPPPPGMKDTTRPRRMTMGFDSV